MSNFKRKIKRNLASAEGLPRGFYCKKMQRKMGEIDTAIAQMNTILEERRASSQEALEDVPVVEDPSSEDNDLDDQKDN